MAAFRLRWLQDRAFSSHYLSELSKIVTSPLAFYTGASRHLIGNKNDKQTSIRLKNGQTAYMNSFMSFYIFDEIFVQKVYESKVMPKTVIDVGANIGLFVLWASNRWPGVEITAYEPEPTNYSVLLKNVKENNLQNVRSFQAALTGDGRNITLFCHPTNSGGHSTVRKIGEALDVSGCSLETALGRLSHDTCDLMKVDCEGGEADIFRSMTSAQSSRITNILYEPEPSLYSISEMNKLLHSLGYETHNIQITDETVINSDKQGMIWAHR